MEYTDQFNNDIDELFYKNADSFFTENRRTALTYEDVTLATRYTEVLPKQTLLDTVLSDQLKLHIPIISSDMDTVTEHKMAIAMALNGGLGLIHYNMSETEQIKEVARVKNHVHGLIQDPIAVKPDMYVQDILDLIERRSYNFHTFPVTDEKGQLLGLLPSRVVKERYATKKVHEAMTPRQEVYTLNESEISDDPIKAADNFFNENMGIHKVLVVDDENNLKGLFTLTDIEKINQEQKADVKPARDSEYRLVCGAAISPTRQANGELDRDRIIAHVDSLCRLGVDAVAISSAHAHTMGVGETIRLIKDEFKDRVTIIAGNVTSGSGVEFLADCGADALKIGQGPGSICTTRIVAGVGIPQLTALYVCSKAAQKRGVKIIADGGITKSGDMVKALTLSDAVICGGLLASAKEAPGDIMEIEGKLYKQYRGMGSLEAMKSGSAARYGHDKSSSKIEKVAAEGIEALKEVSGSLENILRPLTGGIQSGMGYLGAANLTELKKRARYIRVSAAGQRESKPHDVIEVKAK